MWLSPVFPGLLEGITPCSELFFPLSQLWSIKMFPRRGTLTLILHSQSLLELGAQDRTGFGGQSWQEQGAGGRGALLSSEIWVVMMSLSLLWLLKAMKHFIPGAETWHTLSRALFNQLSNLNEANSKTSSCQSPLQSFCFLSKPELFPKTP